MADDSTCNKCYECVKMGLVYCGFCKQELGNRYDIELQILNGIMEKTERTGSCTTKTCHFFIPGAIDPAYENTTGDLCKAGFDKVFKLTPFVNLIGEKIYTLRKEVGKIRNLVFSDNVMISLEQNYTVNNNINAKKQSKFLDLISKVESKMFICEVSYYIEGVDEVNKIISLVFTEKELEDKFEFLRGKNWIFPELGMGLSIGDKPVYSLAKFFVIYKGKIKSWWLKKRLDSL